MLRSSQSALPHITVHAKAKGANMLQSDSRRTLVDLGSGFNISPLVSVSYCICVLLYLCPTVYVWFSPGVVYRVIDSILRRNVIASRKMLAKESN